jgi:hypothetical protein
MSDSEQEHDLDQTQADSHVTPRVRARLPGTGRLTPPQQQRHARLTAQERQRLLRDVGGTGSLRRSIRVDQAPTTIKQFLRGEIDLDTELAQRFAAAPLLTSIVRSPEDNRPSSRAIAALMSQDGGAMTTFDVYAEENITEVTFTLHQMLALRFRLEGLGSYDRRRWVSLMQRPAGVAFLWTSRRWEDDYLISVIRPHYVRMYAFSPQRFEASVRIMHPVARQLVNWLDMRWS